MAGDHDDVGLGRFLPQLAERLQAIRVGQPDVQEHEIENAFRKFLQTLFTAGHGFSGETFVLEDAFQRLPDAWFVIDNEDSWHTGSSMTNRVPFGEFGSAAIYP